MFYSTSIREIFLYDTIETNRDMEFPLTRIQKQRIYFEHKFEADFHFIIVIINLRISKECTSYQYIAWCFPILLLLLPPFIYIYFLNCIRLFGWLIKALGCIIPIEFTSICNTAKFNLLKWQEEFNWNYVQMSYKC